MALVPGFVLILMLLISRAQQSLELKPKHTNEQQALHLFGKLGENVRFEFMPVTQNQSNFYAVLYRSTRDGYLLLKNTSNPSQSSDSEQAERLDYNTFAFTLKNLTFPDSGYYMTQVWKKGILKKERNYSLGITLEVELKPLRFPVATYSRTGSGPGLLRYPLTYSFLKQEGRLTLPCRTFEGYAKEIMWRTPVKDLSVNVSVSHNMSYQEKEDMYIEKRNYSLIIPSVTAKHTGHYECKPDYVPNHIYDDGQMVFVCSDLEDAHVLFSLGGAADLVCSAEVNVSEAKGIFYGHLDQEQEQLSLKPEHMKVIHEEQMKKGTVFHNQFSLTMSNLTLNDSGLYLCRIWGYAEGWRPFCHDRKIYLLHKHPFGIDSTFYRVYSSLMACGLLGMICAVISVHLRVRGRDQTSQQRLRKTADPSGHPTREERQNGGEPDYDDIDTAIDIGE